MIQTLVQYLHDLSYYKEINVLSDVVSWSALLWEEVFFNKGLPLLCLDSPLSLDICSGAKDDYSSAVSLLTVTWALNARFLWFSSHLN